MKGETGHNEFGYLSTIADYSDICRDIMTYAVQTSVLFYLFIQIKLPLLKYLSIWRRIWVFTVSSTYNNYEINTDLFSGRSRP